jgi:acetyl esterase/lipase
VFLFGLFFSMTWPDRAQAQAASSKYPIDDYLEVQSIPLYNGPAPGEAAANPATDPFLTVFLPIGLPTGTAVVLAPGGSYKRLASNHEGRQVADWLSSRGIAVFLLKYRLGIEHLYPVPLQDAQRAIRLVRSRAAEYRIAPDRIGFMGFSAGGHLAAETGVQFDAGNSGAADPIERASSRPDFLVLGYPWLNAMQPAIRGMITYCSVLNISAEQCRRFTEPYTPELHVSAQTPPVFIFHTTTDATVPVETAISFYSALLRAGVPVEMHIFSEGPHGVGLGGTNPDLGLWPVVLEGWLRTRGLLTTAVGTAP